MNPGGPDRVVPRDGRSGPPPYDMNGSAAKNARCCSGYSPGITARPLAFDAITNASRLWNRLLAGVKGRRVALVMTVAAIMDARFEKTWLILVSGGCLYILLVSRRAFRCLPV